MDLQALGVSPGAVLFAVFAAYIVTLLPLFGIVWRASSLVTLTQAALVELRKDVAKFEARAERLELVPEHGRRLVQVEGIQTSQADVLKSHGEQLAVLNARAGERVRSSPDWGSLYPRPQR